MFDPSASGVEAQDLLDRLDATITSYIAGSRSVAIRIPDPVTTGELDDIIADIEAETFVDAVLKSRVTRPKSIPDNIIAGSEVDYAIINHQLAVGAPAAWNARKAMRQEAQIVIQDWWGAGAGQLTSFLDVSLTGTVITGGSDADDHGYHVAGIAAGKFGGGSSRSSLITGINPNKVKLHIIDRANGIADHDADVASLIAAADASGTVVLSTSLGSDCSCIVHYGSCRERSEAMKEGIVWADMVRAAGLESKMFHVTAAGNRSTFDAASGAFICDYDLRDAETQSSYSAAALMTDMVTENGFAVAPLTNTMPVENLRNNTDHPSRVVCLDENSFVGGTIAAIGTDVVSLARTSTATFSGTSMATPQVAGLAAYLVSIEPGLTPQRIKRILLDTAKSPGSGGSASCSDWPTPAPAIDAYAAVLALDDARALDGTRSKAPVRNAILDIVDGSGEEGENGQFDEEDLLYYIEKINEGTERIREGDDKVYYSRADLNGDGYDGGGEEYTEKFNLDIDYPPTFSTVKRTIEEEEVEFDENALTDNDILCYYAYTNLYTGSTVEREILMAARCRRGVMAVYYNHSAEIHFPSVNTICGNDDANIDEQRETLSERPRYETGFYEPRPDDHYWHKGDFDSEIKELSNISNRGFRNAEDQCVYRSYQATADVDALIEHADDGNRLNIDITNVASSDCYDPRGEGLECATSVINTSWVAEFDYEIRAATRLKLVISLQCDGFNGTPSPDLGEQYPFPALDLQFSIYRFDSTGTLIIMNRDFRKVVVPQYFYCNGDYPVVAVQQELEFDEPDIEDATDNIIINVTSFVTTFGNVPGPGPYEWPSQFGSVTNSISMRGFVEVQPMD